MGRPEVRHLLTLLLLAIALLPVAAQTPPSSSAVTVIRAGTLIDPERASAEQNQTIVVENGRVTAVGSHVRVPDGASVIDLSGYSVLPGLFDAHTHLCMGVNVRRDAGNYFYTTLRDPDSFRAIQGVVNARAMLNAGFTTVRDVGNEGNYASACDGKALPRQHGARAPRADSDLRFRPR
jgi:imidazolonepropionase-like amidohydrolase